MARHQHHKGNADSQTLSPSQRYASFQKVQRHRASAAARFAESLPFELDDFQTEANDALEAGSNVLVAAPTGAGKTVVADFAIYLAQERNVKAFYTTPIKALSNQKYHDLVDVYGPDKVGLLTGDTSINSEADIVVMTTEVLRNMLYERSTTLNALRYVILDEVHYLADRFRGPVWEEVIIHLPKTVKIVGLSATVSNVEDFSNWIASVRGDTKLVISEHRPVPLEQHVIVQADEHTEPEVLDLYRRDGNGEQTTKLNAELINRLDQLDRKAARRRGEERPDKRKGFGRGRGGKGAKGHAPKAERHTPRRWAVVDELNFLGMLPGIYFIFSRNGCDQAVEQCINAGLELTTDEEVTKIRRIVDEMVEGQLTQEDLKALQFSKFRFALEEGFASHHAGMIALFRQIVERLFEEGLVKMVFATETLALGINMTPGEFTQLTGRAGRRGIDTIGHAIVVDHHGFVPATAAALSSKRVYPLHSSFRPTFNMAVNLLNSSDYETAHVTLDQSFAQWEANESAWQLESQINTLKNALAGYEQAFACEHGDFKQFMTLRMELSDIEKEGYDSRTGSVARQFDRICDILTGLGYLERHVNAAGHIDMTLTEKGSLLRRIYSEHDLELCEALLAGTFDKLDANGLAAVLSSLVYEARRGGDGEPRHYPGGISGPIAIASSKLKGICEDIDILCEDHGLDEMQRPDFGILDIMYEWADGGSLGSCLYGTDMTGGDFVRTAKRLADVLQQIAVAQPLPFDGGERLAGLAHEAADRVNRGVVAYSGVD